MRWLLVTLLVLVSRAAHSQSVEEATVVESAFEVAADERVEVSVSHAFAASEAIERLGYLFAYWKRRFNIDSQWQGNRVFLSGSIYGIKVEASFLVEASAVSGYARDPGWPLRGRIVAYVEKKLRKYLHATYDEQP